MDEVDLSTLKAGDRVKTDFHREDKDVVRVILDIQHSLKYGSGYRVAMDDGGVCPCCQRALSMRINGIDGDWIREVVSRRSHTLLNERLSGGRVSV